MPTRGLQILIAAAILAFAQSGSAQQRAAGVTTDFVTAEEVSETVSIFGQVVTGRQSDVATRIAGVVGDAPLRVGDTVNKDDVVFRLNTERLQIELELVEAEIDIAEAGLVVAEARLDRTSKALERTETLVENAAVSQAQLDDRSGEYAEALGALQQAEARISAARAGLRRAQYNIENAVVRAPFDGIILEVTAQSGEFVNSGNVVVRLLDSGALEVEANVPSRYIGALQPEQPVGARTDNGSELTMMLRAILPTEFSSTRTRPVRFSLTGDASDIAVGQSITLDVPVSRPETVTVVNKDAVVQSGGGWQVFVHEDGKAAPRRVEIGRAVGSAFEVVSGLSVGDEVVVRGNERLRPGQAIAPTPLERTPEAGQPATNGG